MAESSISRRRHSREPDLDVFYQDGLCIENAIRSHRLDQNLQKAGQCLFEGSSSFAFGDERIVRGCRGLIFVLNISEAVRASVRVFDVVFRHRTITACAFQNDVNNLSKSL